MFGLQNSLGNLFFYLVALLLTIQDEKYGSMENFLLSIRLFAKCIGTLWGRVKMLPGTRQILPPLQSLDLKDKVILADKAYSTAKIRGYLEKQGALACIPDKVNAKVKHEFDEGGTDSRNLPISSATNWTYTFSLRADIFGSPPPIYRTKSWR